MSASYSHTTRASGIVLTASIYNADHVNHINQTPATYDDYSVDVSQMQSTTDPGELGSESLATSLSGELQRLRHMIKEITGEAQWYISNGTSLTYLQSLTLVRRAAGSVTALNTAFTSFAWDTEDRDDQGFWTAVAPSRFTAPFDCRVEVHAQIIWAANASGSRTLTTYVNSSLVAGQACPQSQVSAASAGIATVESVHGILALNSADYVEFYGWQNSGGDLTMQSGVQAFAQIRVIDVG